MKKLKWCKHYIFAMGKFWDYTFHTYYQVDDDYKFCPHCGKKRPKK